MSPSIRTMGFFMSEINFCNTKEQLNHLGEVVTGKVDGSPSGSDIDTSTLPYTGQVRKTLPALESEYEQSIARKEMEADAAIDEYRLLNKGPYASGIALESKFEFITYNGESYFATNPPYTTTATTPDADGNLFAGGYTTLDTVASKIGNPNLLSNHNFLTPSPDAITHPNATPESYAAGTQIFSGVYAGDSGCTITLIDGRVNCTAGSYEYRVPNANGLDRVPVFTSSVSDYDGNPVTTGVSHALVSDEYVVTVTPAAGDVFSVKLEQGDIATRHSVQSYKGQNYTFNNVAEMTSSGAPVGATVEWSGYYDANDKGGNKGVVKYGAHTEDGGHIFSLGADTYVEANFDSSISPLKFGVIPDSPDDALSKWQAFVDFYNTLTYSTAAVPNFSKGPKIEGFGGETYLSAPLAWSGSYYFGDLQGVNFKRHASWSEPTGTYLLQFPDLYGADFGGLIGDGVDYFAEFENNNIDATQVNIDGIQSKQGDWVYRFNLKSAIVYLNNYRFNQSLTALHIDRCDRFYLGRGVIRQGVMTEDKSATVQVDNAVLIAQEGAIGIPNGDNGLAGAPSELAWFNFGRAGIDNTGLSDLRAFRAGGESGSISLANSWIIPDTTYPAVPSGLIVENNDVYATATNGGTLDSCVIRLFRVPNQLIYRDNRGMVDTSKIIAWGQGVDQAVELQKLVGTTIKSFVLDGNVTGDLYARFAPENIRNLFEVRGRINFGTITRPDANNIKIDCGIVPLGKTVSFGFTIAPSTASPSYRTSVKGDIMVKIGNSGGPTQRLELVNYAEAKGGSTFVDDIVVTPVFLDSGSEVTEVSSTNDTATLRLLVSSINGNAATAVLQGYFKVESYLL